MKGITPAPTERPATASGFSSEDGESITCNRKWTRTSQESKQRVNLLKFLKLLHSTRLIG